MTRAEELRKLANLGAAEERRITRQQIEFYAEVERERYYLGYGFSSSMEWLVRELKYSHSAAFRRLEAARLLLKVPSAAEKLESGVLNITTCMQLQTAIRHEEKRTGFPVDFSRQADIVLQVEDLSTREADRKLASLLHQFQPAKRTIVRAASETEVRMHLNFSHEDIAKIERAREILAHKLGKDSRETRAVIMAAVDELLERRDPLKKIVKSRISRAGKSQSPTESDGPVATRFDAGAASHGGTNVGSPGTELEFAL